MVVHAVVVVDQVAEVADHEVALDIDFRMVVAPVGMIPGRGERRR